MEGAAPSRARAHLKSTFGRGRGT